MRVQAPSPAPFNLLGSIPNRRTTIPSTIVFSRNMTDSSSDNQPGTQIQATVVSLTPKKKNKKIVGQRDLTNPTHLADLDHTWREQGSCYRGAVYPTEAFFFTSITRFNINQIHDIQNMCRECPVAANCLYEAILFNYDGMWAGMLPQQRVAYIRHERGGTLEGLTVAECRQILDDLQDNSKITTTAYRRAMRSHRTSRK